MTAVTEDTRTCSSGCQWLSNGEMHSPSTALSPPSKRRSDRTCLVSNIYPRELSTEGQRNNNNNLLICRKQCLTHVQTCHVFQMLCLAYRCRSFVNENTVSCLVLSRSVLLPWKDEVAYPVFCAQSYTVNVVKCNMQVR